MGAIRLFKENRARPSADALGLLLKIKLSFSTQRMLKNSHSISSLEKRSLKSRSSRESESPLLILASKGTTAHSSLTVRQDPERPSLSKVQIKSLQTPNQMISVASCPGSSSTCFRRSAKFIQSIAWWSKEALKMTKAPTSEPRWVQLAWSAAQPWTTSSLVKT